MFMEFTGRVEYFNVSVLIDISIEETKMNLIFPQHKLNTTHFYSFNFVYCDVEKRLGISVSCFHVM